MDNGYDTFPAFANVAAGSTDHVLVSAVTGRKIRFVSGYAIAGSAQTNLTFNTKGAGAGTAISALQANAANGGFVLGVNTLGWFETSAGESLTCTTGTGSPTGITFKYSLI